VSVEVITWLLPRNCLATTVLCRAIIVQLLISRLLPSNGSICQNCFSASIRVCEGNAPQLFPRALLQCVMSPDEWRRHPGSKLSLGASHVLAHVNVLWRPLITDLSPPLAALLGHTECDYTSHRHKLAYTAVPRDTACYMKTCLLWCAQSTACSCKTEHWMLTATGPPQGRGI
jgi:hypothetical protein